MHIHRQKMSKSTYQALKKYIMREREKKKQEQEQDKEQTERIKRERELKKKKEEADSLTLEQTKEQISQLESKLSALKQEKHELFAQLKKVLHIESAQRQRAQLKEQQNEQTALQQQYMVSNVPVHPQLLMQQHQRQQKYMNIPPSQSISSQGAKRIRSPSPPSGQFYAPSQAGHTSKSDAYNIKAAQYPGVLGNFQNQSFAPPPIPNPNSSTTPTPSKYHANPGQFYPSQYPIAQKGDGPQYASINTHKGEGTQYASINYRTGMLPKRPAGSYTNDHLPSKQNYSEEKQLKMQAPAQQQIMASQMVGGMANINEAGIMPTYKNQPTNYNQLNQRTMAAARGMQFSRPARY